MEYLQRERAHPLAACGVATLCCSPPGWSSCPNHALTFSLVRSLYGVDASANHPAHRALHAKLTRGDTITMAAIGGSITEGHGVRPTRPIAEPAGEGGAGLHRTGLYNGTCSSLDDTRDTNYAAGLLT